MRAGRRVGDYDPTTGTFLTRDPLDGVNGTPTVANPYHYVSNDPLNQVDPLGLRQQDADFNPCAGPLSPQGEAYCQKHGAPPSTFCQTNVDQCLGLGGQYQGKTLDAMQYQNREHFMTVFRSYIGSEPQLRVRWIERLGGGSTAVAYMDARDFERAYNEVIAAEQATEPTLKETMVRFAIDAAISGSAAFFCGVSFGFCLVATAALVTGGTFALGHSDYYFGRDFNLAEDFSEAALSAVAGITCGYAFGGKGCLGTFVRAFTPKYPTGNAAKVALIWLASYQVKSGILKKRGQ